MALFQNSVIKRQLKTQDNIAVEKAYKKYAKYFHNPVVQQNIKESKEEQFQEGFLRELFVNVFEYTLNPSANYNLTTELKNEKGAKKADGAILKDGQAIAVIELKGTKTKDLESIRQQAFDYKANHSDCIYVITSNFEKLRFYINNAVEFEEFNLFDLSLEKFALMYFCLHANSLLTNKPLEIKNASIREEESITKKFYSDYSTFKRELYRDLVKKNMKNDVFRTELQREDKDRANKNIKLTLFKKSQKLIDRFLFIFFGEDRGLLPPNSTIQILEDWDKLKELDAHVPLYNRFKLYFNYLDIGRKGTESKKEIFAYNGGLFKSDTILDSLTITDELLYKHTNQLSHYDFDSQIDVNILGHIFENSLNEIESVNAEIEGVEFDKQKTKRKKDGVFYTPKYITKYIVDNTLGKLCKEKKIELGIREEDYLKSRKGRTAKKIKELEELLDQYREWLLSLTILDPACGSGAFLNQALDSLIKEHRYIDELSANLLGNAIVFRDIENTILEKNIYGVDLNEESIEIAKLSLWLRTAQPRRKLNELNNNIKCGNSLIDSKSVAGDKAFRWKEEFSEVFVNGGFDVVIGNPPYVRAELLGSIIPYLKSKYKVFDPSSDLFAYFYELGTELVNPSGIMGFISNTFDKTTAGVALRDYLKSNISIDTYVDFTEVQIFEGATTYPVIILLKKKTTRNSSFEYIKIPKSSQASIIDISMHHKISVEQSSLNSKSWSFTSSGLQKILNKISQNQSLKDKFGKSYRGLITGLNDAFLVSNNWATSENIKPIYDGKEISKWITPPSVQKLILFRSKSTKETYGRDKTESEYLDCMSKDNPDIFEHLSSFEQKAKKRYDKGEYWWELRNCAYYELFEKPKIIFPNLQNRNKFSLDNHGIYINAPAVFLPSDSMTLLCILNSKIVWIFLKSICVVRSGGYIEVKPQYFEQIPIPELKNEEHFESLANRNIESTSNLQSIQLKFKKYLGSQFSLDSLSKKLQNWYNLEFAEFVKEINKAINKSEGEKLTKSDEMEWMELFEEKKAEVQTLKTEIERTDRQIDLLVYELYDLTEEEIEIVENS